MLHLFHPESFGQMELRVEQVDGLSQFSVFIPFKDLDAENVPASIMVRLSDSDLSIPVTHNDDDMSSQFFHGAVSEEFVRKLMGNEYEKISSLGKTSGPQLIAWVCDIEFYTYCRTHQYTGGHGGGGSGEYEVCLPAMRFANCGWKFVFGV